MRAGINRWHSRSRADVDDELTEVEKMMERTQEGLSDEDVIPSVADLLRLMEIRRELAQSKRGPMTVRWIDECRQNSEE
jgi:hypothetical protein